MLFTFDLKYDHHRWFLAMLAVAVFTALTILLQYKFTRERVTEEQIRAGRNRVDRRAAAPLSDQLRAVASEKWWWFVWLFYLSFQGAGAMKNGSRSYFCKWVMDNTFFGSEDAWGASQSLLAILGAIPLAVAALFVVPLSNRFSKRLVCMIGMLLGTVGGVI